MTKRIIRIFLCTLFLLGIGERINAMEITGGKDEKEARRIPHKSLKQQDTILKTILSMESSVEETPKSVNATKKTQDYEQVQEDTLAKIESKLVYNILWHTIPSNLSTALKTNKLVGFRLVSKKWADIISNHHKLVYHVPLDGATDVKKDLPLFSKNIPSALSLSGLNAH